MSELDAWRGRAQLLAWRPERGQLELRAFGDDLRGAGFEPAEPDLEDLYNLHVDASP